MTRFTCLSAGLLLLLVPAVSFAQLADAGQNDQHVSLFFLRADEGGRWVGGVASRGDQGIDAAGRFKVSWQLDYGSLGAARVSPGGTEAADEAAVSKNSGAYTLTYVRRFGAHWRLTADGGVEHKRTAAPSAPADVEHSAAPIAAVAVRTIGARLLGGDPDPGKAPELAWSLQATLASAEAILSGREARKAFLDPVGVAWLSIWPATIARSREADPQQYYRVQLRGEAAVMRGLGDGVDAKGHWDASLVYFFSPANGVMLRRFDGYFDHNLRDRKRATTLNLVWKFK